VVSRIRFFEQFLSRVLHALATSSPSNLSHEHYFRKINNGENRHHAFFCMGYSSLWIISPTLTAAKHNIMGCQTRYLLRNRWDLHRAYVSSRNCEANFGCRFTLDLCLTVHPQCR
jgi:hypothetical protein